MDFEHLVKQIGLLPGTWKLVPFPVGSAEPCAIRNDQGQCPLEALAGTEAHQVGEAMTALAAKGYQHLDLVRLACAADGSHAPFSITDRDALRAVCGC